jgi:hypothetical protein
MYGLSDVYPATQITKYTLHNVCKHKGGKIGHELPTLNGSNLIKLQRISVDSVETTNKMQPCNRIYYSTVHLRLNMFRAVRRSSSGALTLFTAGRSQFPLRLDYGRSPNAYVNQRLQIQLELLMMSGLPLETC